MGLFSYVKNLFTKKPYKLLSEPVSTTEISIIDTSSLEISRDLTDDEKQIKNELYEEISSGNISTFIKFGDDIAKRINYYIEIFRKRIDQNIKDNINISKFANLEDAIRLKVKIAFNNAEIDSIIEELNSLRRDCELRVIALEDLGKQELKKSKRKIFFFGDKFDQTKISSINNAIERLSGNIKIINTLVYSMKKEKETQVLENTSLNQYIDKNDSETTTEITNKVLDEKFEELKNSVTAIGKFSNIPQINLNGIKLSETDISNKTIDEKIKIIALTKRYLDLYVAQNRQKLLEPNGILDNAKKSLNKLWEEIESEYYDRDIWAKRFFYEGSFRNYGKKVIENQGIDIYDKQITDIENLLSIFSEEIPENFKEEFYKTKFYFYALLSETIPLHHGDFGPPFTIKSEEERSYYIKFIENIIEKMHRESSDGELLRFMDKHLKIKDSSQILQQSIKLATLLRIEKYGRYGLYTLILYESKKNGEFNFCCLEQLYGDALDKVSCMNTESFAKDILRLWNMDNDKKRTQNYFWGDNLSLPRKTNPTDRYNAYYSEKFKFVDETYTMLNKKIRMESHKPENQRLWNTKEITITYLDDNFTKNTSSIYLANFITNLCLSIEEFSGGEISKEQVRDTILNFYSIRTTDNDKLLIYKSPDNATSINLKTSLSDLSDTLKEILVGFVYLGFPYGQGISYDKNIDESLPEYKLPKVYRRNIENSDMINYIGNKFLFTRFQGTESQQVSYEHFKFINETSGLIHKKIQKEKNKDKKDRLWNSEFLTLDNGIIGSRTPIRINLSEFICNLATTIEKITGSLVKKEQIRDGILNFKCFKEVNNVNHYIEMFKDKKENSTTPSQISCDLNIYKDLNIPSQDCIFFFEGEIVKEILMQMFDDYANIKLKTDHSPIEILSVMLTNYILDEMYEGKHLSEGIYYKFNGHYVDSDIFKESYQSIITKLNYRYIQALFGSLSNMGFSNLFKYTDLCIKLINDNAPRLSKDKNEEQLSQALANGFKISDCIDLGNFKEKEH